MRRKYQVLNITLIVSEGCRFGWLYVRLANSFYESEAEATLKGEDKYWVK